MGMDWFPSPSREFDSGSTPSGSRGSDGVVSFEVND